MGATGGLTYYIFSRLNTYTLHGETVTVPDLKGMSIAEIEEFLSGKPFKFEIADSVYNKREKKGVVMEQNPKTGAKVKQGRNIYLIINSTQARKVKMPNLVDLSLRQAISILQANGLLIGLLEYEPNIAKNAVIRQKMDSKEIQPGESIAEGSVIDLVLGSGLSDEMVALPSLVGLKWQEAMEMLKKSSLNEGVVNFDETVKTGADSLVAVVVRQNPPHSANRVVPMGELIDMWLSKPNP